MIAIATDRRRIEAEPDPEGEALALRTAREYLDVRLRMAHALLRIESRGTYHFAACSSVVQYALRLGIPAQDARMLVDLARTLDELVRPEDAQSPTVEESVRAGRIPLENAALV